MERQEKEKRRRNLEQYALDCIKEYFQSASPCPPAIHQKHCSQLWRRLYRENNATAQYASFAVGTILRKKWRGQCYELIVTATGFQYGELQFKTLSGAANHITGRQRNGKEFFGVNHGN